MKQIVILTALVLMFQKIYANKSIDSLLTISNIGTSKEKIDAFNKLSYICSDTSCYRAIEYAIKAKELSQIINDRNRTAISYSRLGYSYAIASMYDKALDSDLKALKLFKELKDTSQILTQLGRIGVDYKVKGEYKKGIEYMIEAVRLYEYKKDSIGVARTNSNIGNVYLNMKDYSNALIYYKRAYEIVKVMKHHYGMGIIELAIGSAHSSCKKYELSEKYHLKAIKNIKLSGDKIGLGAVYGSYSELLNKQGNYRKALKYLGYSKRIIEEIKYKEKIPAVFIAYGEIYSNSGNYKKAIYNLLMAKDSAEHYGNIVDLKNTYKLLSENYSYVNDFKKAYKSHTLYHEIKDSINSEETKTKIANIQTQYETEKKEKENQKLKSDVILHKKELTIQKMYVVSLIVFVVLVIVTLYFVWKYQKNKKRLAEQEAEHLKDKLELQNKELAANALALTRNMEFSNSLVDEIKELMPKTDDDNKSTLSSLVSSIKTQFSDGAWEEFEARFSQVHNRFLDNLKEKHADLTPNEVKLCVFLKLGLSSKEIASTTSRTVRSVETARTRLRKKLDIPTETNLITYINEV